MRRDVFQAIADPTRRGIIKLVSGRSLNLNAVAEEFDISRPAISRHIKILTECGLIIIRQQGRERFCEARLQSLIEVSEWVNKYRDFWTAKFNALGKFLEKEETENKEVRTVLPARNNKKSFTSKNKLKRK